MDPSEEVEIEIGLRSTWWKNPPRCKIYLDNNVIQQNTAVDAPLIVKWKGILLAKDYVIKVVRQGKNFREDVVLDDQGKIIKDQLLEIEYVKIDGIRIQRQLYRCSKFYESDKVDPKEYTGLMNMGENGIWELKFSVPTYMWLLQNL